MTIPNHASEMKSGKVTLLAPLYGMSLVRDQLTKQGNLTLMSEAHVCGGLYVAIND